MFIMKRNNTEAMKYDQGYIWAWYYGYGFMDDYGNYHEKYNRGYPKEFQNGYPKEFQKGIPERISKMVLTIRNQYPTL